MDPRIRGRRAQVRKQHTRRRLRLLFALTAAVALGLAAWGATKSPLLDVDKVQVDGAAHTAPDLVLESTGIAPKSAMTDVDESAAERRVRALPWVLHASVERHWPATVRVLVTERTAVAVAPNQAGGWAVADAYGRILEWPSAPPPGLLLIEGLSPAGSPGSQLAAPGTDLLRVGAMTPSALRPKVKSVALDDVGIVLRLTDSATIVLGDGSDMEAKLASAEQVMAGVETTNLAVLDVRLPTAPTITRTNLDSQAARR